MTYETDPFETILDRYENELRSNTKLREEADSFRQAQYNTKKALDDTLILVRKLEEENQDLRTRLALQETKANPLKPDEMNF